MRQLDLVALDKRHTLRVNKLTDIDHYGREGKINDEYTPPEIEPFQEKEHLRSFMADPSGRGRDQFVMYRGDSVGVFWNNDKDAPENIVDRPGWTETFVQWSPLGTYLTSVHAQGVQLWGGPSWIRQRRFAHPFVNMVAFSPNENYLVTWSNRPISIPDEGHPSLSLDDDGKNYVIWDVKTSKPLRSFAQLDVASGPDDLARKPAKLPWPAFKWSADDKYVARLTQGSAISVYELPRMNLLDKTTIKVEGVMDFDWAPATVQREGFKGYEQLLCYWTPEIGSNPAKVSLMSIPSKQVVRTLNLFSVSDAKLHWQSEGAYLCVKVDRHSKSKKSQATTLEIFRVKEKGVPVEVVDTIKDTVINFAWEPKGDRFVIITTTEPVGATAVPPKTSVSFFCPEKAKGNAVGNFKHLRTLDKKNSNAIYWSPKGRFVVVATVANTQSSDLDFFDLDFEGEKPESDKDLTANLQLMNTADHYGVTDVEWDPSGRYVATWASAWKHAVRYIYPLEAVLRQRRVADNVSCSDGERIPPVRLQGRATARGAHREIQAVAVEAAPPYASHQGGTEDDPQEPARVLARLRAGGCRAHQQRRRGGRRAPPPPTGGVVRMAGAGGGGDCGGARGSRPTRCCRAAQGQDCRVGCGRRTTGHRGDCGGGPGGDRGDCPIAAVVYLATSPLNLIFWALVAAVRSRGCGGLVTQGIISRMISSSSLSPMPMVMRHGMGSFFVFCIFCALDSEESALARDFASRSEKWKHRC